MKIVSGGSASQNNFPLQLKGPQRSVVVGGGLWHTRHLGEELVVEVLLILYSTWVAS
jgi:hypothetical protein